VDAYNIEHQKDEELLDIFIASQGAHVLSRDNTSNQGGEVITATTVEDKDHLTNTTIISKQSPDGSPETVVITEPSLKKESWFNKTKNSIKYSFISRETYVLTSTWTIA
jgi:hypothetical protein